MVSSLELLILFVDSLEVTTVSSFVADLNLSSWELDNFTFTLFCSVVLYWYYTKTKYIQNALMVLAKTNFLFPALFRFPVILICCIASVSASSV